MKFLIQGTKNSYLSEPSTMATEIQKPVAYEEFQLAETHQKQPRERRFDISWRSVLGIALFGAVCIGVGFGIAYATRGKYTKRNFCFSRT